MWELEKKFEGKKTRNNLEEKSREWELRIQKAKHIYLSCHHQSQADSEEWPCNWVWVQRKILLRIHHWWAISREQHTTGCSEQKVRKIQRWSQIHDHIIFTWTTPYPPVIIFSLLCQKSGWWSVRLPSRDLCFSGSAENTLCSSGKHSWLGLWAASSIQIWSNPYLPQGLENTNFHHLVDFMMFFF